MASYFLAYRDITIVLDKCFGKSLFFWTQFFGIFSIRNAILLF